ncbi:putative phage abortive infection protein [Saccharicrinis aurantiacus]|uniref:putative phage abortive infection protein n=1 Tax=Saccharicrinis aurantiacus TaxID=1849719 RepID=UPI00094FD203|nr:putative phage abortive infection protein [Saccharicrinis aurantiacus]
MKNKKTTRINYWYIVLALFVIAIVLIIIQFIRAGAGLTINIEPVLWGQFGSFIGSFLLAVTLLFQIRAFRRQQVEAKFFEMVKYYRENISEMRFRNPFYYKSNTRESDEEFVSGRRVIKTIFEQYKVAQKLVLEVINQNEKYFKTIDIPNSVIKKNLHLDESEWKKRYVINELAYMLVYWGIPLDIDDELRKYTQKVLIDKGTRAILNEAPKIVAVYECEGKKENYLKNLKSKIVYSKKAPLNEVWKCSKSLPKIKFFGGHQYHLGHYFRHFYQTVKYIDRQPSWLLSKNDKYDYIKTIRAQMSNYEQALLFINSLTALGRKWEYSNIDNRKLISDYNLINNLPESFIPLMKPQCFYPVVDFEWDEEEKASKKKVEMEGKEFIKFLKQEEQKDNETKFVLWARVVKNIFQYLIGAGVICIIGYELFQELFMWPNCDWNFVVKYTEMPILQMVSIGLAAATAVELGYMLFTPGPDEAVQPVMMGIASFVLYSLSLGINELTGIQLIGMALLIATIPLLFWVTEKYINNKKTNND